MNTVQNNKKPREPRSSDPGPCREVYFFCDRKTGVSHFHVQADPDGELPLEKASCLLAIHCLVHGHSPGDYVVMMSAAEKSLKGLVAKAEKMLEAGQPLGSSVNLTRREEEVLADVVHGLANKEIAASLNLSEGTVKFHISSLFAKFRVGGRMELLREVTRRSPESMAAPESFAKREARRTDLCSAPTSHHTAPHVGLIALAKRQ